LLYKHNFGLIVMPELGKPEFQIANLLEDYLWDKGNFAKVI